MKISPKTSLSMIGLGMIVAAPVLFFNSNTEITFTQLGLAIMIYAHFQERRNTIEVLGLSFLLLNLIRYGDILELLYPGKTPYFLIFPRTNYVLCTAAILFGIGRHIHKIISSKKK